MSESVDMKFLRRVMDKVMNWDIRQNILKQFGCMEKVDEGGLTKRTQQRCLGLEGGRGDPERR